MHIRKNKFIFLVFILLFFSFVSATSYGEKIVTDQYEISRSIVERNISPGTLFEDFVEIKNLGNSLMAISISFDGKASELIEVLNSSVSIMPGESKKINFLLKGTDLGEYDGNLFLSGNIQETLPVKIVIGEDSSSTPFLLDVSSLKNHFDKGKELYFKINIKKLKKENLQGVIFDYFIHGQDNLSYDFGKETFSLNNSYSFVKEFPPFENLSEGKYIFEIISSYGDYVVSDRSEFFLETPFFEILVFGIFPMKYLLISAGGLFVIFLTIFLIKKRIKGKKKYKMNLDLKSIPKKNEDFLFLGKIAEMNHPAFLDPNRLTTHSIVAGATGGGKSISAQVIIEELLKKNIAVIVFDPTAQWSGMLRKCTDKKMMEYYSRFGLKPQDAKAFKGNVRQVQNARQIIDINKYINPGQIQIFSLNKLPPKDMDIFVSNVIRQIFKSDPKESPVLKVLIVFDEVHRLLPKFGGNGEGFLQIERGCREFRKWGIGIMLVSQVLSDFVGEIKANISTEVQMRTRDEGDLNRVKTKYGESFLQSLVKASVGVGMFSNPAYNHAKPYFVNFRPILHSTRRLPDEELEKYNKYNDLVDDLEFSINELEKLKIDTFDLKMELKLIKDKIMSGSFSVVDIYLEGLSPRVDKEWEKLGKKAPKRKIELVSEDEIKKSIEEAKKQRKKVEEKEGPKTEKTAEPVKEDIENKQVTPLTFNNGVMIGTIKELKDYLKTMDDSIFAEHVNDSKNDISKWVEENFGKEFSSNLNSTDKSEIIKGLDSFGKEKKKEATKEKKKESKVKEEKKK